MTYLSRIKQLPLLSTDDTHTTEQLVLSHLRLVLSTIRKTYSIDHPLFDDLIQVGNMALLQSARTFDPNNGTPFATYAIPWIKLAAMNHALDYQHQVKMLTTQPIRKAFFNRTDYITVDGKLDKQRMSDELGISIDVIDEMERRVTCKYVSVHTDDSDDGDGDRVELPDGDSDPVQVLMKLEHQQFMEDDLRHAVKQLPDRHRLVIEKRYGDEPVILKDLANTLGVSIERVRQIEQDALKKLYTALIHKRNHLG